MYYILHFSFYFSLFRTYYEIRLTAFLILCIFYNKANLRSKSLDKLACNCTQYGHMIFFFAVSPPPHSWEKILMVHILSVFVIFSSSEPLGSQGELIVYPWSGVRRCRPSVYIFKHLLLWNRLTNQSQILCGASLGRGNESLYKWSRSHDQDGRHTQKCSKP